MKRTLVSTNAGPHRREGFLRSVKLEDGQPSSEASLPAAPVYDGIAVAGGRAIASLEDGRVICLGP